MNRVFPDSLSRNDVPDITRAIAETLRNEQERNIVEATQALYNKVKDDVRNMAAELRQQLRSDAAQHQTEFAVHAGKSLSGIADERIKVKATELETSFAQHRIDASARIDLVEAQMASVLVQLTALKEMYLAGMAELKSFLQALPQTVVNVSPTPVEIKNEMQTPVVNVQNSVSPTPVEIRNEVQPAPVNVTNEVNPTPVNIDNRIDMPAREKRIEYDENGRPVVVQERNL